MDKGGNLIHMNEEEKLFAFLVGALIYKLRKEKGMTQKELASKVNLPQQYISKILKGRENLSLETLAKIEDALNLRLVYETEMV